MPWCKWYAKIFKQTCSSDVLTANQGGNSNRTSVNVNSSYSHSHQDTVANVAKSSRYSTSSNSLALVLCELLVFLAKQKVQTGACQQRVDQAVCPPSWNPHSSLKVIEMLTSADMPKTCHGINQYTKHHKTNDTHLS